LTGFWSGKEPDLRPRRPAPVAKSSEQLRRQHHVAIALPLALLDPQRHALAVDIGHLQAHDLGHAQARAVGDLCQRFDILTSIPGVGEVTANVLVVETPELGRLEHAQAASLVGLAPVPRDSGQTHGKRSIRGGHPRARQALYMPALNAIRLNPEFKAKYQAMVKAGKPAKVAIVAITRKLLILANALIRDRRKWAPTNP
jgi:transposase